MMSLGATVLKVGMSKILEPTSTTSGVNKVGVAASTTKLTNAEKLHQQQVLVIVFCDRNDCFLPGPGICVQADS